MIAANAALGEFMYANKIPALYRNHNIPPELLPGVTDPKQRAELLGLMARVTYDLEPTGHVGLNRPLYVHGTSPIRRFSDFVNHANLVAFLDDRKYPYTGRFLRHVADRLNMLAQKEAAESAGNRPGRRRSSSGGESTVSPHRKTDYLLGRFTDGSAGPGEIATALFDASGSPEEVAATKTAAAHYVAERIHHARPALAIALARKHAALQAIPPATGRGNTKIVLADTSGNTYPYPTNTNPVQRSVAYTRLIGAICGTAVEPIIPENRTREAVILRNGDAYLHRLADEGRIKLRTYTHIESDGQAYAGYSITIGDERHEVGTTMSSRTQARRNAAAELITQLDLINTVPPVMPEIAQGSSRTAVKKEQRLNPVVILQARQQTARAEQPTYSFSEGSGYKDSQFTCTVRLTGKDGKPYEATATATGKTAAKRSAAAALLAQLPEQPTRKKKKPE
jgi:hypothetical protein